MAVKCVSMYEASDGRVFPSRHEALAHDALQKVMNRIRTTMSQPGMNVAPNLQAIELANNVKIATQLRDDLNKALEYHRGYGKLKPTKKS